MPTQDPIKNQVPFSQPVYFSYELIRNLPVKDADLLMEELAQLYFDKEPGELRKIIERGKGNPDLVQTYKDEAMQKLIMTDYAYDTSILAKRKGDQVAQRLIESINEYNSKVDRQQQMRGKAQGVKPEVAETEEEPEELERAAERKE